MATDTFLTTSGTQAWDVASNWSLGQVPQPTNDVSITGPATAISTITIAATDPAYTVASLTEVNQKPTFPEQTIDVSGSLTVTGTTSISAGFLYGLGSSILNLNTVVLSNSAELFDEGTAQATLTIGTASGSSGTIGVFAGTTKIGAVSGTISVNVSSGGTAIVGSSSGSGFFGLSGGDLVLQSTAATLGDTLEASNQVSTVDLSRFAYQPGETASTVLTSSNTFKTYTITLSSISGQTLYTFQNVTDIGNAAQTPPLVSLGSDGSGGTLVTLACFTPATLIQTPSGEVQAGELQIGDEVVTVEGNTKPIIWIGRRSYAGRFLARQRHLLPIRFRAGALGEGLPRRDLLVSPNHSMFIDGVLVPAECLVNGSTITQEAHLDRVDYVHIELAAHDIILAEGSPTETFIDDDSRNAFSNAAEFARLYPDRSNLPPVYHATRLTEGYEVEAIRCRLAGLAAGFRRAA